MNIKSLLSYNTDVLIQGLIQKKPEAQRELYNLYHKQILGICYRYFFNEENAVETTNDVFIIVFEKINQFKNEGSFEGWIKRITINTCINKLNKELKRKKLFVSEHEQEFFNIPDIPDNENEIDKITLSQQEILHLLASLPPASRTVFNLYAIDELTHRQISEKLKISEGTSKWHLNNARKMMQFKIKELIVQKTNNNKKFNSL